MFLNILKLWYLKLWILKLNIWNLFTDKNQFSTTRTWKIKAKYKSGTNIYHIFQKNFSFIGFNVDINSWLWYSQWSECDGILVLQHWNIFTTKWFHNLEKRLQNINWMNCHIIFPVSFYKKFNARKVENLAQSSYITDRSVALDKLTLLITYW